MASRRPQQLRGIGLPTQRGAWSWLLGEDPPPSPRPATRDEALSLPAFGRGVELIASSIAGVPLQAFRRNAALGVWEKLADQPAVLTDPDPLNDEWQWKYGAVKDLIEAGNHVSWFGDQLDYRTGRPAWLEPLPIADVGVVQVPDSPAGYMFTVVGVPRLLDPSEVLHISAGNRSGEILGRGIVEQYAPTLGQALTAEQWSGRYLQGGGLPPAIIQHRVEPTVEQKRNFKDRWRTMLDTGEAMLLPADATVTPLQSDAQRQQLVEARTWNVQLTSIMLGIPAHKYSLQGPTMTYENVETADIAWIRDTVDRWAQPISRAVSKWLLPLGTEARWAWASRMRTDTKTQFETASLAVEKGLLERDEGRQLINYAPADKASGAGSTPEGVPNLGAQEVA